MSFGIELGILAAVRDCIVRDARRFDACVDRRDRRENMGMKYKENAKLTVDTVNANTRVLLPIGAFLRGWWWMGEVEVRSR